eukprot:5880579-Pleurochrysis_carterae.AAC.1
MDPSRVDLRHNLANRLKFKLASSLRDEPLTRLPGNDYLHDVQQEEPQGEDELNLHIGNDKQAPPFVQKEANGCRKKTACNVELACL